ncbi:MAG: cytochrome c biogenesis protein CcsA [Thermoanaerobaculia bacterium]|jgi:ABC-type transport system involved in cytochrome c biogenesis permease subunit|nr:cytochrome c biogenesis protein CcsA [Thermoanaerobaculia bacterium]
MSGTGLSNLLFGLLALVCYGGATTLYVTWLRHPRVSAGRLATLLAAAGAVFNFVFLYVRSLALKTVPYSDLLGSMALFGLFLAAMSLILETRHHDRSLGAFLMPVSLFFLLHSFLLPGGTPPPPEMRGSIFAFHVTLNMLSYSAFAVACALSLLYLVLGRRLRSKRHVLNGPVSRLPSLSYLERAARTSIGVGVVSLATGLTMGFYWAYRVWHEQHPDWLLDAKVWGSVVTLAFYLWVFVRAHRGAAPGSTAKLSIAGFVLVLLSYTAVNLFFSKVHSFA